MPPIEERFLEFVQRFLGGGNCYQFEFQLFSSFLLSHTEERPCQP